LQRSRGSRSRPAREGGEPPDLPVPDQPGRGSNPPGSGCPTGPRGGRTCPTTRPSPDREGVRPRSPRFLVGDVGLTSAASVSEACDPTMIGTTFTPDVASHARKVLPPRFLSRSSAAVLERILGRGYGWRTPEPSANAANRADSPPPR
jgi:hypothetical protein